MSRAVRIIKLISEMNPVRPIPRNKEDWEWACGDKIDKESTSWRSIIDPPTVKNVKPNTGRGHKG